MPFRNHTRAALLSGAAAALLVLALAVGVPTGAAGAAGPSVGLHVSGNRLLDGSGQTVVLRGVNRSGSEYACIQGFGFFDGPSDVASIAAMASWHINTVRVPLNEDCWLGINGSPATYSGANYQTAIKDYVSRLHAAGLVAVLDLHWTAAGTNQSNSQQNMPDADHAPAFWTSVATAFRGDGSAVFDLFNEPHDVSWTCWRDGADCGTGYQVAGMQSLVNTVRATGATNPILIGGLAYANDLSQWLTYRPSDSAGNLLAAWHSYNFNACRTSSCWDSQIAPVAATVPLVTGEVGENDCAHGYLDTVLPWLDAHGAGYLGWGWNTFDCGSFPALISNYDGTPTNFGIGLRNHLASLGGGGTPPPTSAPPTSTPPTSTPPTSTPPTSTPPTSTPPSSTPTTTPRPTVTPSSTAPSGAGTVVALPSANTSSAPWWWEEDLDLKPSATITSLNVTVTVARTPGVSYSGFYSNAPGGALTLAETTGASTLVYRASLNSGQSLAGITDLKLGVQYSGSGTAHAVSGDTYTVTATVSGTTVTRSGHF